MLSAAISSPTGTRLRPWPHRGSSTPTSCGALSPNGSPDGGWPINPSCSTTSAPERLVGERACGGDSTGVLGADTHANGTRGSGVGVASQAMASDMLCYSGGTFRYDY